MHKLFFWNNWHNGDLVLCRPLVRQILNQFDVQIAWGCWRNQAYIVEDLPVRVLADSRDEPRHNNPPTLLHLCPPGHAPIYLWVGAFPDTKFHLWEYTVEIYNRQVRTHGLSNLQISSRWVPMMDFPPVDVAVADNAIFVENGGVRSFHSDFHFDMTVLAREFPDLVFYCTADPGCQAPNIVDCSRLNLVQLSSVGEKCDAIVGKGSGPFCSTLTEANRYKPKAVLRYHPHDGPTLWDYPGNPLQYLETHEELVRFFRYVQSRKKLYLLPGSPTHVRHADALTPTPDKVSADLDLLIQKCRRNPSDGPLIAQIRPARDRLVQVWLNTPADHLEATYRGAFGKTHRQFMSIDARNVCLRLPGAETPPPGLATPDHLAGHLRNGASSPDAIRHLLVSMLCSAPQTLPVSIDPRTLPDYLREDFISYTLQPPGFFQAIGDADGYLRFLQDAVAGLHRAVHAEPKWLPAPQAALRFLQQANFIATYFNEANVKDLFSQRGDLLQFALRSAGLPVDHAFPSRPDGRKIRLGVLAAHFTPSAETYASLPYYEYLGDDFEVTLYALQGTNHPFEQYCRSCARALKVLPPNLPDQAALIRADDLDILFFATNVAAVTNQVCLLALHRLARAQTTSIFSVVTTGLPTMDYYLSGTQTDPLLNAQDSYREKLVRVEGSVHCFSYGNETPPTPPRRNRASLNIPPNAVVFASGANFFKMIPELIHAWAQILARVPDSVLMLFPFGPNWSNAYPKPDFAKHVNAIFAQHGVAAGRVKLLDPTPAPDRHGMKEFFKLADVYLDSYPFSGSTSLMEPLQIGLPVVVKQGAQLRGSMGAAMMQEMSLPQLVADTEQAYVDLAVELGTNPQRRREIADQIRATMQAGPRFADSRSFAARIGLVFKQLVESIK